MSTGSTVIGTREIIFVRQGDSINTRLYVTRPLEQFIKKDTATITPDWAVVANQPTIYPAVKSSLMNVRLSPLLGSEFWKYNGVTIAFDSGGLSTVMGSIAAGTFKKESKAMDGDIVVPTLKICKNIASVSNINTDVIEFTATVNTGFSTVISSSIDLRIEEIVGDAYTGHIAVNDGGVIDDNTSSLTLTAQLYKGGAEVNAGITYQWFKASGDTWVNTLKTTKAIILTKDDINTQELYKCVFLKSTNEVSSAAISVYDESDPLVVVLNPDGDEEISSARRTIIYSPRVCKRGDMTLTAILGYTFEYLLTNNRYTEIATGAGVSFSVTYDHAVEAKGNMTIIITATN